MGLAAGTTAIGNPAGPAFVPLIQEFADSGRLYIRTSPYVGHNSACGIFIGVDERHPRYLDFPVNRDPEAILRIAGSSLDSTGRSRGAAGA